MDSVHYARVHGDVIFIEKQVMSSGALVYIKHIYATHKQLPAATSSKQLLAVNSGYS